MFKASKVFFILSILMAIATAIAVPKIEENYNTYTPQSISISASSRTLEVGYYTSLYATIAPSTATGEIIWKSSNTNIATVSSYGGKDATVTAKNPGTVTITATTKNGKKASCTLTVTAQVKGISLNQTSNSISKGDSFTLIATITPSNATNKTITWRSSNTNVATVSNGVVTGISGGTSTITATTNNNLSASCSVTVSNTAITYTISYNLNGGTVSTANPTSYTKLDSISLSRPTKTGYTFSGWTGSNGSTPQKSVSIPTGSSGNKSYTANWTANTYNVSYVLNEGTFGSYHPTTLSYDTTSTISNPTKAYATFTGWNIAGMDGATHIYGSNTTTNTSISNTKETSFKNLRSTNGTVTFTANWTYTNYSISYNLGGGTNGSSNPSTYTYYDSITLNVPTRNGYTFIGWTGSNGTTPQRDVVIHKNSTGNKTYTANWSLATYSITYNLNGGTIDGTNPTSYTLNSSSFTLINPTKNNYTFAGWTGSNGTVKQTIITIPNGSYGDRTYTANWTPTEYSITYILKGGTNDLSNKTSYNIETNTFTINNPTRNGYIFTGWTCSNGDIPQTGITINKGSTGDKVYIANWETETYNISYNLNGGILNGENPSTYTVEDEDIVFINPTRDYYSFNYWSNAYCYNSNNKEYGIKKGTYGDKTIAAYWTPINYTITYNLDGGTVLSSNKSNYNIETSTFTLNNPTKVGFEFIGWTGSSGDIPQKNVTIDKGSNGDKVYIANWEAQQYTLKFVTNCPTSTEDLTQDCGTALLLPQLVWENKSLEGWYKDENLTIKFNEQIMPAENITLYAKWITYDITISPNELTAISINTELTPAAIGASALDTDGENLELSLTYSGNFAIGETILIRLSTNGKYNTQKQKTYNSVKIYGMPNISYDNAKDYICLTDELTPSLFNVIGTDTFGENTTNTLYVKEESYSAGDKVTIVIKCIDIAGNESVIEIPNIKVYGEPIITCDSEKIKALDGNNYTAEHINTKAYDSFGKEISISVENITTITTLDIDTGFVNGDTYSYTTSNTQNIKNFIAYNTEKYTLYYKNSSSSSSYKTYVIVYCDTTNTTINSFYCSSTYYNSYSFNVTTGYSYSIKTQKYSYSATFYMYLRSATNTINSTLYPTIYPSVNFVGKVISLKLTATDDFENSYTKNVDFKVYGTPLISNPTKTLFKDTETISYETLGFTSRDSFNDEITNASIQLTSGELVAGSTLQYLVTVTDSVGNQAQKTISNIQVYGIPVITYNTDKKSIKITDNINATLFNVTAKDSFNNDLTVQTEINSGTLTAGQKIRIKFTTIDCVGNIKELITDEIGVYSANDITITYNQYLSDYIKLTSKGEEFNAVAKDSFNNNIEIKVVATNGTLAGGNIISLKFVATDNSGNVKESEIINNIKVYDTPNITCNLTRNYLYATDDIIELYIIATDNFGDEIVPSISIKSGENTPGSKVTYLVIATDKAGNSKESEFSFDVIGDNQAYATLDVNGGSLIDMDFCGISLNQNYQLPILTKLDYIFMGWYDDNGIQYTDRNGNSVKQFTAKGEYNLIAHWQLKYLINYELDGGHIDGAYPTSYTAEDQITLVEPVKTGYNFIGWTGSNGAAPQLNVVIPLGNSGDKSYTANWSIIEYTITYTLNGGTFNGTYTTSYTIESDSITLINPIKSGYAFAGWSGSNGEIAELQVVISSGSIGDKNYVAHWTPIEYTIIYELNGGTINGINPTTYTIESNSITLINPTRTNYEFAGWTGSNGATPQSSIVIASGNYGNKSFTANWTPINYTINYDLSGGSVVTNNPTLYNIETETFSLVVPTRTGYTFTGWTGSNGSTPQIIVSISSGSNGNKSYIANWEAINYTITYNLNGGVINGTNPVEYTIESDSFVLINPTKDYYQFTGWTGSNGDTPQTCITIPKGSIGDKTYTANWNCVDYTINYVLDGGINDPDNPISYNVETETFALLRPINKLGYTFVGWTGSNGDTPQTSITITKGSFGNKTYTANWQVVEYAITYNLNGGTIDGDNPTKYTIESDDITLINPTRDYYTFVGWTGSNGSTPHNTVVIASGSYGHKSYTANWMPINYTLSYDLSGGSVETNNPTSYNVETETFSLATPTKTGYTFIGWTGSNGTIPQTSVTIAQGNIGNKSYIANWEIANYTITYNLNGGSVNGTNPATYTINSSAITLINPTRANYEFVGWTGSNGATPQSSIVIASGSYGNKSYTANWTPIHYTISYDLSGGSVATNNPTSYNVETETFSLVLPTKTGYIFTGWTGSNGEIAELQVVISSGSIGDKNYVAHWTPIEYSITYELNGGTINGTNPTTYTIKSEDITLQNPIKDGYTFLGWTGSNGTTPQTSVAIVQGSMENKSYTANWTVRTYTITYNLNGGSISGTNPNTYTIESSNITLINPIKSDGTFAGWTGSNGSTPQISVTITQGSTGNKTYTANWTEKVNTITYNLDGGTNLNSINEFKKGDLNINLQDAYKNDYYFDGWYTEDSFVKKVTSITEAKNITLYAKFIAATEGLTYSNSSVVGYAGSDENIIIPNYHGNIKILSIGDNAFKNNSIIKSILMPEGIISIGDSALNNCTSLTCIKLPNSLEKIGSLAFGDSSSIVYNIKNGIKYLGNDENLYLVAVHTQDYYASSYSLDTNTKILHGTFSSCSNLTKIVIPFGVKNIGCFTFSGCTSLTSITIPNSVEVIGEWAFDGCSSLATIDLPNSVTNIDHDAFADCSSLTNIVIPNSVTTIGSRILKNCISLTSITLSENITLISSRAFNNCSALTEFTIPERVNRIESGAFAGCSSLTSITIPCNVTLIEDNAFTSCSSLISIFFVNSNGWYRSYSSVSNDHMSDPTTAANFLVRVYNSYQWTRKK